MGTGIMRKLFKSVKDLLKSTEISHRHNWGPVYTYKGFKYRNCTHPGCNAATAKDDYGNWLDPW
jgi:hypothetical protein